MSWLINTVGGAYKQRPEDLHKLSDPAKTLLDTAFQDIPAGSILDYHTHLGGIGTNGSGCCTHQYLHSMAHPLRMAKLKVFASGGGVKNEANWDREYVERLVSLIRNTPEQYKTKHLLLAFDGWIDSNGNMDMHRTGLFVPNDYMFSVVEEFPDCFEPCISVHPNRKDALELLEKYAAKGARVVKWLPPSMGMDPSNPAYDAYYDKMIDLGMSLLTHTGFENSIDPPGMDNSLGHPLLLRRPLSRGLRVIAAHCASEGEGPDLDNIPPPSSKKKPAVLPNYKFFLRLMDDKQYEGLIFGDISAVVGFKRLGPPLTDILDRQDLHHRLVFGSDYPLPAIAVVVHTSKLRSQGYISKAEEKLLDEIYHYNPILFDIVTKRVIKSPTTGKKFLPCIFKRSEALAAPYPAKTLFTMPVSEPAPSSSTTTTTATTTETPSETVPTTNEASSAPAASAEGVTQLSNEAPPSETEPKETPPAAEKQPEPQPEQKQEQPQPPEKEKETTPTDTADNSAPEPAVDAEEAHKQPVEVDANPQ